MIVLVFERFMTVYTVSSQDRHKIFSRLRHRLTQYARTQVRSYEPDEEMQRLVDSHMQVVKQLEGEIIVNHSSSLSSRNMRREQTSIGSVITSACKDELGVELVMINGGPIKGNRDYDDGRVSYLELKEELPFPTKLVTLDMPGSVIELSLIHI